jgi:aspartate ammonia-lyase
MGRWWARIALNLHIRYEKAAKISLAAQREGISLREAALKSGFLTGEPFDEWVRPLEMARPRSVVIRYGIMYAYSCSVYFCER